MEANRQEPPKPIHPCPVFSVLGANDLGPRSCFREVDYSEDQECGEDLELEAVVRSSRGEFPECFDTSRSSELLGKGLEPALQNCSLNTPCAECGEIQKFSMPATTLRRTHMLARPDQRAKAGLGFHQMLSAESRAPLPPCSSASARAPAWPSGLTTPHSTLQDAKEMRLQVLSICLSTKRRAGTQPVRVCRLLGFGGFMPVASF